MLNYKLCKKLKEAGFSQGGKGTYWETLLGNPLDPDDKIYIPTLSELIEECGDEFGNLWKNSEIKTKWFVAVSSKMILSPLTETYLPSAVESAKTPEEAVALVHIGQETLSMIENLGKPVICAMNGLAFGGGNELAMACTARIAKKGLRVLAGQPEPKLGIIPGYGGTQRLPRIAGLSSAWPILRTGNPISSSEALEIGLISEEVEGDIIEAGITLAKKVISGETNIPPIKKEPIEVPDSLPEVDIGYLSRKTDELLKKAILEGARMTLDEGLKHEAKTFGECLETKDMRIGMENFIKHGPKKNAKFAHV